MSPDTMTQSEKVEALDQWAEETYHWMLNAREWMVKAASTGPSHAKTNTNPPPPPPPTYPK